MSDNIEANVNTPSITPGKALIMLIGIIVVIGVFLVLCFTLGITEFWAGFLFVLYWGMFEGVEIKKLPHVVIGGFVGLLSGYLSHALVDVIGPSGGLVFIAFIALVIYCQLLGWLKVAVNPMTMIFLTVSTIPVLAEHTTFSSQLLGFGFGIVFFGGFISIGKYFKDRAAA